MESTFSVNIPTEVLRRFGGITNYQKQMLYTQYQSLGFVDIPAFLKPQIANIDALLKFGVCEAPHNAQGRASYFVCPHTPSPAQVPFEEQPRYCCGPPSQQMCCTLSDFIAGIRVIRSDLLVSPSIVIGFSLVFLLLTVFITIIVYSCLAKSLRKQSTQLRCSTYLDPNLNDLGGKCAQFLTAGSIRSSTNSSHIPPQKHLLSAGSLKEVAATRFPKQTTPYQKKTSVKSIRTCVPATIAEQKTSKEMTSQPKEAEMQSTITAVKMRK